MVAPDLYPLSTQDGQAVPLEVVEALAFRAYDLDPGVTLNGTIPEDWNLVYIYCKGTDCFLRNDATPLPAAPLGLSLSPVTYDRTMYIPQDVMITALLNPTVISIKSLGDGVLYISSIRRWAGLNQAQQVSTQ